MQDSCIRDIDKALLLKVHKGKAPVTFKSHKLCGHFLKMLVLVEIEQLFDNPFTLSYFALKMSLSHHKQIKAAGFVHQYRYCLISSDWCIVS